MNVGKNLKVIRNRRNISQQEIADFLGIDRKTYASWEAGTDVKCAYIPKLAKFFQVEIEDLFQEKSADIMIDALNTSVENKDAQGNNIILVLTDKESANQLADIIKERLERK